MAKFTGSNTLGNSIIYDNGTNVGIGTTTPGQRLDVSGSVKFTGALMPNDNAGTPGQVLTSQGAGTPPIWTNISSQAWSLTGNAGTTAGTNFIGTTDSVDMVFKTKNIENMRITATGNVGIGTTTPAQKLDVNGGASITGGLNVNSKVNFLVGGNLGGVYSYGNGKLSVNGDNVGDSTLVVQGSIHAKIVGSGSSSGYLAVDRDANIYGNIYLRGNASSIYLNGNASSIYLNGNAGTTGQVLTSQGAGSPPIWTSNVSSFNGRTGAVVPATGDYNINQLAGVSISSPTTNQLLRYDGTNWVNWTPNYLTANQNITFTASGDISGSATGNTSLSPTLTINNKAVTYAKIQDVTSGALLGRYATTNGTVQEITLGSGLSLNTTTGVLSATGTVSGTGTSGNFPIWSGVFGSSSSSLSNSGLVENSNVLQINDSVVYLPDSNSSIKVTRINPYLLDSSGNKNYGSFSSLGGIFSSFYALLVDTVPSNHVLELNLKNINGLKYGIVNVYAGSLTGTDTVYLPPIDQACSLNSEYGGYDFVVIPIRIFIRHSTSSIFVSVAKSDINKGVVLMGLNNVPAVLVNPQQYPTLSFYPDKFNNDWIVTF
ncbi:MAG: hypothetical protein IRZ03_19175 [Acidobacterium ailaaui]|nr:hypothetical protein [Pseudacidobacterium ailaaui]